MCALLSGLYTGGDHEGEMEGGGGGGRRRGGGLDKEGKKCVFNDVLMYIMLECLPSLLNLEPKN